MKKPSLLKQYQSDPEAQAFIQKHSMEFKPLSYEDDQNAFFYPDFVTITDLTLIIKGTHLLANKSHQLFMDDYFSGMSIQDLTTKYGYANDKTTSMSVVKFKKTILKRIYKNLDAQFAVEMERIDFNKHPVLKQMSIQNGKKTTVIILVKVPFKNKLQYEYSEEDRLTVANKYAIIKKYCTPLEQKRVNKMGDLTKVKPYQFNTLCEIVRQFRWVNIDGNFLTKGVDDALTDILGLEENRSEVKLFN